MSRHPSSGYSSRAASTTGDLVADRILRLFEAAGAPLLMVALLVAKAYRRYAGFGRHDAPVARRLYKTIGVYPVIDHFYEPWPSTPEVGRRDLPGISLDLDEQVSLLREFEPETFNVDLAKNSEYTYGDADLLWHMVRHYRPSMMVEVGSGYSTRIVAMSGAVGRHIAIDPQPRADIVGLDVESIRQPVQDVGLSLFRELGPGDVLFIDSSHVIRPKGDVLHLYLRVLPELAKGVIVHVHDVFTPWDYPRRWLEKELRLWNEQYLLEGMLSVGKFHPVLAAHALWRERRDDVERVCPSTVGRDASPSAFWFEVK